MKRLSILLALLLVAGVAQADPDRDTRGYLGISVANVENVDAGSEQNGVYVHSVNPGSGAEVAGLKADDRLVSINGVPVRQMEDMDRVLDTTRPGDSVDVVIRRDGREEGYTVVLGERTDANIFFGDKARFKYLVELSERGPRMGVHLQGLSSQLADYFEVDGGALISSVDPESAAQSAGLRAGDILVDVNGRAVQNEQDVYQALKGLVAGDTVNVTVQSRGRLEVLAVTLDEAAPEGNAAFNVLLRKSDSASTTLELDVPAGDNIEFRPSEESAEALRAKIKRLQAELERLEKELQRLGDD